MKELYKNPCNHPCYGKHHSEETRKKMSEAKKALNLRENLEYARIKVDFSQKESLSYLLGALLGDGYVTRVRYKVRGVPCFDYRILLRVKDKEFAEKVAEELRKVGLNPKVCRTKDGYWKTQARSKIFYHWFKTVNPKQFLDSEECKLAFLTGIFDAEGYFSKNIYFSHRRGRYYIKYGISICNNDTNLIHFVKELLEELGFHPWVRGTRNKSGSITYKVSLSRVPEVKKFLEVVKSCIPRKRWQEVGYN
jgi:DNA-binding transcriptional regulator WhiA